MRQIVYNAVQCLECNEIIESLHRHDYKTCSCPNETMCDGGTSYLRWGGVSMSKVKSLAVYADEPFEKVRQFAHRTGYGKPGAKDYGTFRKTNLCNMTDEHLQASLDYPNVTKGGTHWQLLLQEKLYRVEHEIFINDPN